MTRFPLWLAPFVALAGAICLRYIDPGPVEAMRLATFDEYQRIKPAQWQDAGVRIVDLDDESLTRIGQWPWPRTKVAELLLKLGEAGVAVVAFDIVFAEPDRTSPRALVSAWGGLARDPLLGELAARLPDNDEALADALRQVPSVVGFPGLDAPADRLPAQKWGWGIAGDDPKQFLIARPGARPNLPVIEAAALGQGSFFALPDRDGIYRHVAMLMLIRPPGTEGTIYPSLSLEALRVVQQASTYVVRSSGASGQTAFGEQTGVNAVRVGKLVVPTDGQARVWIRDTGPVRERVVPAWRVLEGELAADALEGTIVYIGTSAPGLRDLRAMPLNPAASGVELHARTTEQILLGEFLDRPDWTTGVEVIWLAVLGAVLVFSRPRAGPIRCAVIGAVGVAVSIGASWYAFDRHGLLIDPVFPAAAATMLYVIGSLESFLRTEAERRRVRGAFSHYLSPTMVARLAADPSALKLGGETREMTIMFTDIRGFTTRSESMDAAGLTRFLNRFLTPMTATIQEHRGTLDKYIGDAIMAFWNAPLDDPDHAEHAGHAALSMLRELDKLNALMVEEARAAGENFPPIAIGIGLNSGPVSVGNMGSDLVFGYTVIGDDVNLASRLESRSKTYGVGIVIGENTQRLLPPGFAVLELDLVRVKGKKRPVKIYTIMGDAKTAAEPWFVTLSEQHAAMLAAYRSQEWSGATAAILRARAAADGRLDGLYELYRERIAAFRERPPPEDWDGVEIATEK